MAYAVVECGRCGSDVETNGRLAKCDCGWYEWWPLGEPEPKYHPGW